MTRRTFIQSAACATAAAGLSSGQTRTGVTPELSEFPYGAVELLDGPMKRQFDENHAFFLGLSEDRLLKIYRQRVGLPAPGEDMGGWYDGFCPGAHFGQYVSALARFAAATGSEPTRAKVRRLVQGYAQTVEKSDRFFVDLRYPAYTYDKLVCGLMDAHSWAGDPNAIAVLYATTRAARPHMAERALTGEEQQSRPHRDETYTWDETYTLAENLFLAYERTNDKMFFDMGKQYLLDRTFFDPLSQGQDVLPGLHAYSHVNALSSGMQGYFKLGDPKYLRAVTNAVDMIWSDQSFATGGWGPNEGFVAPGKGRLAESLAGTRRSFETPCGSYAHFKVMRYLLRVTKDARYGDSMERVLWNTVLGAKPIREDGSSFYYSDYHPSGFKTYTRDIPDAKYEWDRNDKWPCCSGTLPQIAADYVVSAYLRDQEGIYVNLYVPSRVTWTAGRVRCTLRQETRYPTENLITLRVDPAAKAEFTVRLRVPAWAGPGTSLSVNGKRQSGTPAAGAFASIRRSWKAGDRVELELDQPVRTEAVDRQNPDQAAILRGPQVLFAVADAPIAVGAAQLRTLRAAPGTDGEWTVRTEQGDVALRPFSRIGDERYQTYGRLV